MTHHLAHVISYYLHLAHTAPTRVQQEAARHTALWYAGRIGVAFG